LTDIEDDEIMPASKDAHSHLLAGVAYADETE
jgi:hypothetical protein